MNWTQLSTKWIPWLLQMGLTGAQAYLAFSPQGQKNPWLAPVLSAVQGQVAPVAGPGVVKPVGLVLFLTALMTPATTS